VPSGFGENIKRSMQCRKAVSVLPLPVGARMRVDSFLTSAGQPSVCARVADGNDAENHAFTAGWNTFSTEAPSLATGLVLRVGLARGDRHFIAVRAGSWHGHDVRTRDVGRRKDCRSPAQKKRVLGVTLASARALRLLILGRNG
jgi:hypothetical protein